MPTIQEILGLIYQNRIKVFENPNWSVSGDDRFYFVILPPKRVFLGENHLTKHNHIPLDNNLKVGDAVVVPSEYGGFGGYIKVVILEIKENSCGDDIITRIKYEDEVIDCDFVGEENKKDRVTSGSLGNIGGVIFAYIERDNAIIEGSSTLEIRIPPYNGDTVPIYINGTIIEAPVKSLMKAQGKKGLNKESLEKFCVDLIADKWLRDGKI